MNIYEHVSTQGGKKFRSFLATSSAVSRPQEEEVLSIYWMEDLAYAPSF